MTRDILYVLSTPAFFMEGPCGRVSHARGFVAGVRGHDKTLTLVSGPGPETFVEEGGPVRFETCKPGALWWPRLLARLAGRVRRHRVVVVRWRPILPFLLWPFLALNRNIWFEVNALTGLDSRHAWVRWTVRSSVRLSATLFNLITVSEPSLERIQSVAKVRRSSYVMPNGFDPTGLVEFRGSFEPGCPPALVYFGIRQSYYEWDLLYAATEKLVEQGIISAFHGFGYDEQREGKAIISHGRFDRDSLVRDLAGLTNPILVIHSAGSDAARATSPVKLFEYAALAAPIVCSSSMRRQAKPLEAVSFYEAGAQEDFERTVRHVAENYEEELVRAAASRQAAWKYYTWPAVVGRWLPCAL